MKTRIVETKFWKDSYVSELTPNEKLLYLFFLTTEKVNIIHCYEITEREIAFDTGIDTSIIRATKKKLEKDGKLAFFKDYVCLINAYKYESYTGVINEGAKQKLIQQLGEDVAKWYRGIYRGINTQPIGSINNKSEIINNKPKIIDNNSGEGIKLLRKRRKELGL